LTFQEKCVINLDGMAPSLKVSIIIFPGLPDFVCTFGQR
jgi:hypothetical protein